MVRRRWWWLWCAVSQVSPPHIHLSPKLHLPHIAPSAAPGGEAGVQVVREWSRVVMVMETVIVLVRRGLSRVVMVRRLRLRMRTIVMIRIDIEYPSMVDADT